MKVLVPAHVHDELTIALADVLPDVQILPYTEDGPADVDHMDAVAVFRWVAGKRYERLVLEGKQVAWLHTASAGIDHVLTPALKEWGGFTLTDSGPAFGICMGEYVLTWMLALAHRVPQLLKHQSQREWNQKLPHEELFGQTVGVIGLGPIGQGVAQRCKAFGMRVLGYRRSDRPAQNVDTVLTGLDGLQVLLEQSDWIVVAAALTGETRALLGREELTLLKPTATLINVARGPLVEEAALIDALQQQRIGGAVLDVFDREPLSDDSPLWNLPNTYITPHNAPGWTSGLRRRQIQLFVDNMVRFAHQEPLEGVVDMGRGY